MNINYINILIRALLLSAIGVFVIDFFSHLLFSSPMETIPYFMAKMAFYFLFSVIFFAAIDLKNNEFAKILVAGVSVSLLWGMYYNIFPLLVNYYPFGIALSGLTFLGMGMLGTGIAFGIIHISAFVGGYYGAKFLLKTF